jgi:hypothetical protein
VVLKEKEKLARKKSQRNKGKSPRRGRVVVKEKFQNPRPEAGRYHSQIKRGGIYVRGHYGGRKYFPRGRRRGRGGKVKCYSCGKTWHMSWECPERKIREVDKLTFMKHRRGM